ncbi:Pal1 cell morphology protein-domain-containing protein [Peziza echinospora]|nr:Pal1 cell morphology protein-domain-containing protein [Peziza echinospora]
MSLVQPPPVPERKPSPQQFGSNNPFRNRASQAVPYSPISPISPGTAGAEDPFGNGRAQRPQSRNPFLDVFGDEEDLLEPPARSIHKANSFDASSTPRPKLKGAAAELFENLTITDHDRRESTTRPNQGTRDPNRDAMKPTIPPGQLPTFKGRPPPPPPAGHRHSKSSEVRPPITSGSSFPSRTKGPPLTATSTRNLPPTEALRPRPRRNSDSSIMDAHEIDREKAKEKERRERKAKEARAAAETSGSKDKEGRRPSKSVVKTKKGSPLDIIDKLDVTGIYGSGLFHHDGPFDACNPHRNKNVRRAPMQAFPEGSANNALTGFGPLPEKGDHTKLFGNRDPEAYSDYSMAAGRRGSSDDVLKRPAALRSTSFDPVARVEPVHGDETLGLGSSTFLDGAPASKKAILQQINETQQAELLADKGGLGRKKSLSHKIRGLSGGRPRYNTDGSSRRRESDEGISPSDPRFSPTAPAQPRKRTENNPPSFDYDAGYDRKPEVLDAERRDRAPSSPKKPPNYAGEASGGIAGAGGSLMKRVRSLSKPKKKE